jgi:prepilin peptidase CpaA
MRPEVLLAAASLFLKATAILLLIRIAVTDFRQHKIYNTELLSLLALALVIVTTESMRQQSPSPALGAAIASAAIFAVLIVFWLARKVGAGDVKLLAIVPLLVGYSGALPMVLALLAFALAAFLVMKFPALLPARWFRLLAQSLDSKGRVPFGVPISAATIVTLLLPVAG